MISVNSLYDKVDRAIIYLSQNKWMDKWKVQKGVFYFLWLDSLANKYDFEKVVHDIGYEPYKQGPFSEFIDGEVEALIKDGFLDVKNPESKILPVKASEDGKNEFIDEIESGEKIYLQEIRDLLEKLNSEEVVFFIYFNPNIPDQIKNYFISKSEIKDLVASNKDKYLKKLLVLGIIDEFGAAKIKKSIENAK